MTPNETIRSIWANRQKETQKQLARHTGVSQQHMSDIMAGKRSLTTEVAKLLPEPYRSAALKAIANELLSGGRSLLKEIK